MEVRTGVRNGRNGKGSAIRNRNFLKLNGMQLEIQVQNENGIQCNYKWCMECNYKWDMENEP